ncbi:membrane protein [Microbacterium phage Cece]|nr:membrane protein [Microbacterium phage Cece]
MKLRTALGPALALSLATLLVACSSISAGRITEKVIEPERHYTVCTPIGKIISCSNHHDDQDWRFDIADKDKEGWVYVTPETFDQYQVGDWVDFSDN